MPKLMTIVAAIAVATGPVHASPDANYQQYDVSIYRGHIRYPSYMAVSQIYPMHTSNIMTQIRSGINFGGHYNLAEGDCGTGCSYWILSNLITGKIVSGPSRPTPRGAIEQGDIPGLSLKYVPDSLIVQASWKQSANGKSGLFDNKSKCYRQDAAYANKKWIWLGRKWETSC